MVKIRIAAAIVLSATSIGWASSWIKQTLQERVDLAEAVLIGTVDKIDVRKSGDGQEVFTFYTFKDLSVVSGNFEGETFVLRITGGEILDHLNRTGVKSHIPGISDLTFQVDQRLLLLVKGNGVRDCPLVGCHQGVYQESSDESGRSTWIPYLPKTEASSTSPGRSVSRSAKPSSDPGTPGDAPPSGGFTDAPEKGKAVPASFLIDRTSEGTTKARASLNDFKKSPSAPSAPAGTGGNRFKFSAPIPAARSADKDVPIGRKSGVAVSPPGAR